jgi:CRISPR-associated protein Cmr6
MPLIIPESTQRLIQTVPLRERHPGLQLDKYSPVGDQNVQKQALEEVCQIPPSPFYHTLLARWKQTLHQIPGTVFFTGRTLGAFTLHLARAAALENAGICLHSIYGFPYIPGSGLKGIARAYAETIWLPIQTGPNWSSAADELWNQALDQIDAVFGYVPYIEPARETLQQMSDLAREVDRRRKLRSKERSKKGEDAHAGQIIFHDAWPEVWPRLMVDIVNNHHPEYYQAAVEDMTHPPGDWENPVPVYFLAIKPQTTFLFALSKWRASVPDQLLHLAQSWLVGVLQYLGAGAKTNAGYGVFTLTEHENTTYQKETKNIWITATRDDGHFPLRAECTVETELLTPAFLAGADQFGPQAREGCDLRSAALRGLLRWWWRTLHAGFVDVKTLRALEAAIWGSTATGGAVRVIIERLREKTPEPYDKRNHASFNNQLKSSEYGISTADPQKTTQGLWYISYGMDERARGQSRRRYYLPPGARWELRLVARSSSYPPGGQNNKKTLIPAKQVLEQAQAALWLLCHFGGVGAKSRKGFGSLKLTGLGDWNVEKCRQIAASLRRSLELSNTFQDNRAHSFSLQQMLNVIEVTFSWPNIWSVLDQIGFAYQAFAKRLAHDRTKMGLGLPRRIGSPAHGHFRPRPPVTPDGRHASPVFIHIDHREGNSWLVRIVAFPAAYLPELAISRALLMRFLESMRAELQRRSQLPPPPIPNPGRPVEEASPTPLVGTPEIVSTTSLSSGPELPPAGSRVEAELLAEKTKKGGWKARHPGTGLKGAIVNSNDVPADKKPGDKVELVVLFANRQEIQFRYPTEEKEHNSKGKRK